MKENIKNENNKKSTSWMVLGIFALATTLICVFVFLFNYNRAYDNDTGGGWVSPRSGVIVWHYLLAIIFILAAIILKITLKKRIRIWMLLLVSVLIPTICYNFNFRAFKKDGFLYPLVDKGGIFHFITIGDYNFDGINDEIYYIEHNEREYSTRYGGHFDDTIVDYIDTNAVGTGGGLSGCHCFYDWEEQIIKLYLNEDSVKLRQVEIFIAFKEQSVAHNVSFYLDNSKLNHTVHKYNTVSIVFDADTCLDLQNRIGSGNRYIPIKYVVSE